MTTLRVDPHGLSALAASCTSQAATVRSAVVADGASGPAFQATSAAVGTSDSRVAAACRSLGERIEDLASKLSSAAAAYRGDDHDSATALGRAGDRMAP